MGESTGRVRHKARVTDAIAEGIGVWRKKEASERQCVPPEAIDYIVDAILAALPESDYEILLQDKKVRIKVWDKNYI